MQEFSTEWFDTEQTNLQARCYARVMRDFREVRVDWAVYMRLKNSSDSIGQLIYIDLLVSSSPSTIGSQQERIKDTDEAWTGTTEHSAGGIMTFESNSAGTGTLIFNSTSDFASPVVFSNKQLAIAWDAYNPDEDQESLMPFRSVFTTEEYLDNHKALSPRNNLCNNKSKYVFGHNKYKNVN